MKKPWFAPDDINFLWNKNMLPSQETAMSVSSPCQTHRHTITCESDFSYSYIWSILASFTMVHCISVDFSILHMQLNFISHYILYKALMILGYIDLMMIMMIFIYGSAVLPYFHAPIYCTMPLQTKFRYHENILLRICFFRFLGTYHWHVKDWVRWVVPDILGVMHNNSDSKSASPSDMGVYSERSVLSSVQALVGHKTEDENFLVCLPRKVPKRRGKT